MTLPAISGTVRVATQPWLGLQGVKPALDCPSNDSRTKIERRCLYESAELEMRHTGNRIGGSNPSLSAKTF
jgi:hypothetical protein